MVEIMVGSYPLSINEEVTFQYLLGLHSSDVFRG